MRECDGTCIIVQGFFFAKHMNTEQPRLDLVCACVCVCGKYYAIDLVDSFSITFTFHFILNCLACLKEKMWETSNRISNSTHSTTFDLRRWTNDTPTNVLLHSMNKYPITSTVFSPWINWTEQRWMNGKPKSKKRREKNTASKLSAREKKHIEYTNIFLRQINSEMLLLYVLFIVVVFVLIAWLVNGTDFNLIPNLMPWKALIIFQCFGNVTKVMCY